jgi:hypothetical protein
MAGSAKGVQRRLTKENQVSAFLFVPDAVWDDYLKEVLVSILTPAHETLKSRTVAFKFLGTMMCPSVMKYSIRRCMMYTLLHYF